MRKRRRRLVDLIEEGQDRQQLPALAAVTDARIGSLRKAWSGAARPNPECVP